MSSRRRSDRAHPRLETARNVLAAIFVVTLVLAVTPGRSDAASDAGGQGTDTSLPTTESAVTVSGHGDYAGLKVTVNQTRDLVNQAISVTWEGGAPTVPAGPSRFGANYLQIFQCWGEDDGTVPDNPGPPPEQCAGGAVTAIYGGASQKLAQAVPGGAASTRVLSRVGFADYDPANGPTDARTGNQFRAFRAVDGTEIGVPFDYSFNPQIQGGSYWLNPYFNSITTNEIIGAATDPTGRGQEIFQAVTGIEGPGLGCGQKVEPVPGADPKVPKCWLVVVPRSSAATEDQGSGFANPDLGVATSPFSPKAWANRIAIPLEFSPVDSPCSIGADDRRLVGSELVLPAVTSWQPALCPSPSSPPFVYGAVTDAAARQQIVSPSVGAPGMAVTPDPIDPALESPANPTVYAPLTLSGITIGFNVERVPNLETASPDELDLFGVRVADIRLTPRLVAKLLTQSYTTQTHIIGDPGYTWDDRNPTTMGTDPDFLRFNPEFELLSQFGRNFGGLVFSVRNSDSTRAVWNWILADPEAKAWLDGQPDEWGMRVNPVYATTAEANSTGIAFAGSGAPESFPKADPYCFQAATLANGVEPPALCGPDWMPYQSSLRDVARSVRLADSGAKTDPDPFALTSDAVWKRDGPQVLGYRNIVGVTDTASAASFGIQQARLSRAGDDGAERDFVAPDTDGLLKGLESMRPRLVDEVLQPDPAAEVPGAYPLTQLTYAAIRPLQLDRAAREDYARFLDYAAGAGQVSGLAPGQLPIGYAELPSELTAQTVAAAETVRTLEAPPAPPAPESSGGSSGGSGTGSGSSPSPSRRSATTTTTIAAVSEQAVVEQAASSTPEAGPLTPILALARNRFFIPVIAGIGVLSVLGALEVTKRPRRARGGSTTGGGT